MARIGRSSARQRSIEEFFFPPPAPEPEPVTPPGERAQRRPGLFLALVALVAWTAGLGGAVVGTKLAITDKTPARTPSTLGLVQAQPRGEPLPTMDAYVAASVIGPSIVAIQVAQKVNGATVRGSGTGIVLTKDGEIVTNAHVVGGSTTVQVRLPGETEPRTASVVASDPRRDLALVHVDAVALQPATFADAADIRVGDHVLAVGFALALDGDPSVTEGIVSALDRTSADETKSLKGLIQTDAPISSGNSGGPLVNSLGQVVGLVTFVATAENGSQANDLGFAIGNAELEMGISALRAAAKGAPLVAGYLGVQLGERTDGGSGALVVEVVASSPADVAGLKVGDIVVAVDGRPISGQAALAATIRDRRPGDSLQIDVRRNGASLRLSAVLTDRPAG